MSKINLILKKLDSLIELLVNSKKDEVASFFRQKKNNLTKEVNNKNLVINILEELSKLSVMSQYGDFSFEEEKILFEICNLSIEFLSKNDANRTVGSK